MNPLTGIHSVAVNDCVVKSFPKCYSDCQFLAGNPLRSFDQSHQLIQQRRDGLNLTRYPSVDVEERSTCSCLSNLQSQIRSLVRSLCWNHWQMPHARPRASHSPWRTESNNPNRLP